MSLIPTASQTVGPFFNFALTTNRCLGILAREGAEGERIRVAFRVVDGDGVAHPGRFADRVVAGRRAGQVCACA